MRGLLNRKPLPNPLLKGEGTFNIDLDLAENNFRKRSIKVVYFAFLIAYLTVYSVFFAQLPDLHIQHLKHPKCEH